MGINKLVASLQNMPVYMKKEQIFYKKCIFVVLTMILCSCSKSKDIPVAKKLDTVIPEEYRYDIKDTISELKISHHEGTEYADAYVDSGVLYISKSVLQSVQNIEVWENGFKPQPSKFDLYLAGKNNLNELFLKKDGYLGNKYIVKGKVIGLKHGYFLFRVDSYSKIEDR